MGRKEVEIALVGKDEGAGNLLEKTGHQLKALHKEAAASGENRVKALLGGDPEEIANLLGGAKVGLAIFATDKIAEGIANIAEKYNSVREQVEAGKMDWEEGRFEIAKTIPVFGTILDAASSVRDVYIDTKREIEAINQETERNNQFTEHQVSLAKQVREEHIATAAILRQMANEAKSAGMVGEAAGAEAIRQKKEAAIEAAEEAARQRKEKAAEDPEMKKTQQEIFDLQRRKAELENPSAVNSALRTAAKATGLGAFVPGEDKEELKRTNEKLEAAKDRQRILREGAGKEKGEADIDEKKKAAAAENLADAQQYKQQRDLGIAREEDARLAEENINRAKSDGAKARMQIAGEGYAAEQAGRKQQFDEEQSNIRADLKKKILAESDPQEQLNILGRANALLEAKKEAFAAQAEQAKKQQGQSEADLAAEAKELELKQQGKFLEAELLQIHQHYADRIEAAKSGAEREALAAAEAAETAEAKRKGAIDERDHQHEIRTSLEGFRIGQLEEKAMLNSANKRELLIAQSAARSREKIQAQQKILDDVRSTAQEKHEAQANIDQEKSDERMREKRIRTDRLQENRRGVEGLQLGNGYTGIGAMYKAGAEPGMTGKSDPAHQTAEHAKNTVTAIEKMHGEVAKLVSILTSRGIVIRNGAGL